MEHHEVCLRQLTFLCWLQVWHSASQKVVDIFTLQTPRDCAQCPHVPFVFALHHSTYPVNQLHDLKIDCAYSDSESHTPDFSPHCHWVCRTPVKNPLEGQVSALYILMLKSQSRILLFAVRAVMWAICTELLWKLLPLRDTCTILYNGIGRTYA